MAMKPWWMRTVDSLILVAAMTFSAVAISHTAAMWMLRSDFLIAMRCDFVTLGHLGLMFNFFGSNRSHLCKFLIIETQVATRDVCMLFPLLVVACSYRRPGQVSFEPPSRAAQEESLHLSFLHRREPFYPAL